MSKKKKNDREFLFMMEARMCNPNGDPLEENKPRMDNPREYAHILSERMKRTARKQINEYIDLRLHGAVYSVTGEVFNETGPVQVIPFN
jgi:CRISPR-associated protein Csh2